MKIYRSKVDLWLVLLVLCPLAYALFMGVKENKTEVFYIIIPVLLIMVYMFYSVKYIIDGNILHIKTGLFISGKINIQDIKSVTKTYNPLSAPALSVNRLEIKYGKNYDYALISPKNREEFVQQLLSVNPAIKVKL